MDTFESLIKSMRESGKSYSEIAGLLNKSLKDQQVEENRRKAEVERKKREAENAIAQKKIEEALNKKKAHYKTLIEEALKTDTYDNNVYAALFALVTLNFLPTGHLAPHVPDDMDRLFGYISQLAKEHISFFGDPEKFILQIHHLK